MIRLFSFFVNLFFPARCMFCREYLPYDADKPFCDGCRAAFTGVVPRKTPIPAGVCFYALDYEADVRRALIAYKFHNKPQYARALGELLVPLIAPLGHVDCITWAPVSALRLSRRGYDQSRAACRSRRACAEHSRTVPASQAPPYPQAVSNAA